ncbi:MAG: hypothetical protein LUG61_10890 [Lachnospiraceae bacterium]|nr:hypothetical protein [Lachnospiraceae bacterium]
MKITAAERKIIEWVQEHILVLFVIFVSVCGLLIRWFLREIESVDAANCLLPWYQEMKAGGGFAALRNQVGNYNVLYQFLIAAMTYVPIYALSAYKALSVIFDYALAFMASALVHEIASEHKKGIAVLTYTLVLLSPLVWLNSSAWGQCDSIYCFWIVAAFYCLCRDRYSLAFLLYGVAFAFKLQAIFALPFFLLFWFMKKRFSVLNFLLIPLVLIISTIPAMIAGREGGLLIGFQIYASQPGSEILYNNYPSFWTLVSTSAPPDYRMIMYAGMFVAAAVMISLAADWAEHRVKPDPVNALYMFFLLTYACVLFMPGMHERYGYVYEILGILVAVVNRKTRALLPVLSGITLFTYGQVLFGVEIQLTALAVINCAVFLIYTCLLTKELHAA